RYPGQRTRGRRCNLVALGNPKVILTNLSTTRRVVTRAAATTPSGMNYDDSLEIPSESYDLSFGIAYDVKSATNISVLKWSGSPAGSNATTGHRSHLHFQSHS